MDAKCYVCKGPAKRYSSKTSKRGVRCGTCSYKARRQKVIDGAARWRRANPEKAKAGESARYLARKKETIRRYGGKCGRCPESNHIFLTVDHINDDGGQDRKERKGKVSDIHTWLKRNGYPDDLQILCGNCNLKKEISRRRKACSSSWERSQRAKLEVIDKYGGKCTCCGEADMDKLVMDHVHGGGSEAKKSYPSRNVYYFLKSRLTDLNNFQVMCQNCNQAKATLGVCPGHLERG